MKLKILATSNNILEIDNTKYNYKIEKQLINNRE